MIKGFEDVVPDLTEYEIKNIIPVVVQGLRTKRGKSNAITNKEMIKGLTRNKILTERGKPLSEATMRKIINYIRVNDLIERLVASSEGYWIEPIDDNVRVYIESLQQRENEIRRVREALMRQVGDLPKRKTIEQIKQESIFN
jgi:hypothetical protein